MLGVSIRATPDTDVDAEINILRRVAEKDGLEPGLIDRIADETDTVVRNFVERGRELKALRSQLTGLRRLAGSRGVKCLFFGDPTGKGRHYSGVGGGLGEAVIFGLDWSGRSNLSL